MIKEPKLAADKALQIVMNQINKPKKGEEGTIKIGFLGQMRGKEMPIIPTGSLALDAALGIGGYPQGRIIEIYGPESCIDSESFLQFEIWSEDLKKRINHKGGTISRLYERFHGVTVEDTPNQGRHLQTKENTICYIKSVDQDGSVVRNQVLDVLKTGKKLCYQLHTEYGQKLIATNDHKFLTPDGFKKLSDIKEGDIIFVHNNTRRIGRKDYTQRPEVFVKYHPNLPTKIVTDKKTKKDYVYYRGQVSRLVYEAFLNNVSYEKYVEILNTVEKEEINKFNFLPHNIHVHHIDEDFTNNNLDNLCLLDPSEHGKLHAFDHKANLSFVAVPAVVVRKELIGERETYDLRCEFPYNNYIANGIVVHNSGKTTLCLHAVVQAQALGFTVAYIDVEHTVDVVYAAKLGVNVDALLFSQPSDGDEAMEIADMLTRSGQVKLIIVDSIASLVTKAEMEKGIAENNMGVQARLMSQALRKLTVKGTESGTTIIFTNQIRNKIGCVSPETLVTFRLTNGVD